MALPRKQQTDADRQIKTDISMKRFAKRARRSYSYKTTRFARASTCYCAWYFVIKRFQVSYVSCTYDGVSGGYSTLQAALNIGRDRRVRLFYIFVSVKHTFDVGVNIQFHKMYGRLFARVVHSFLVEYRSVSPPDTTRVNKTISRG